MKGIEGSPFIGKFQGFGGKSFDSVAGILQSKTVDVGGATWRKNVVKWNRNDIVSSEEAIAASKFRQKSIALYKQALGSEFIVPTEIVVGSKQDQTGLKYKVYQVQSVVEGWTGRDVPEEVRSDPIVVRRWRGLSQKLFRLYQVANQINHFIPEDERFPITLTLGDSRQRSYLEEASESLPSTKNLIVGSNDFQIHLFDFGAYVSWNESMQAAYDGIIEGVKPRSLGNSGVLWTEDKAA